ncbi:FYVE, RhoGEF and PH domain-containing protein 6-like isoform X2 [Lycorma delicatula]|uniref:FYVE, RhoGEF and PH domain-containing protein 6-like isoform X2 n=1 Tax=Lycorma delicatula TaxID=130591 RepID=UPI003F50D558
MDSNTVGKFKPKPPPKPLLDRKLSDSKPDFGKQLQQNKKLKSIPAQKQYSSTLQRDQKPPLLPKPQGINKPKLSIETCYNVSYSSHPCFSSITLSTDKIFDSENIIDGGGAEISDASRSEVCCRNEIQENESSESSLICKYNLIQPVEVIETIETDGFLAENQSVHYKKLDSVCDNSFVDNIFDFNEPCIKVADVNIFESSNVDKTSQSNTCDQTNDLCKECDATVDHIVSSSSTYKHCDTQSISALPEWTYTEPDLTSLTLLDKSLGGELDSQSSDSSCGSFTVISSDFLVEDERQNAVNNSSINSSLEDSRNRSFLYSLNNSIHKTEDDSSKSELIQSEQKFNQNQLSIESSMASILETSIPVVTPLHFLNKFESSDLTKRVESEENVAAKYWPEDEQEKLNNSVESESGEASVSVRRRLSTWFGSFGKGNKQKDKRESCLFYCDQTESVDSNENLENVSQGQISDDKSFKVPTCSLNFDPDNNRSSVSEESSEIDQQSVLNTGSVLIDRKQRKAFFVAQELMTSEKVFIDVLKLLCFDFKNSLKVYCKDFKSPVIPEDEFDKIIASLPQLLSLSQDLLFDLESRINDWSKLPKISDVIVKKGPFLKLFSVYIQNFESQCNHLDDCCHKYPRFAKAMKSFELSDRCKKLSVKHYMLKPVQRIPQYRLLLDDYLAHLDEESLDYNDTQIALNIVSDVVNHANKSIKNGDHLCKLLQLQSQLGNYEIIQPWRRFIKEGELCKLSRKENQLRYFILLNDCLLYISFYGSMTGLRVNYELPLSGMKVTVPQVEDSNSEFNIITSTRSFTLRARSEAECNEWITALQNAIKENNNRQLSFLNMNVAKNAAVETIKLGKEAPIWIQDKRVTMCQACTAEFTVTFRRHHCRACGKVVCSNCSENKAPLQYMKFQTARVCDECHNYLLNEFEDPISNMFEIIKTELCLTDYHAIAKAIDHIRSSFKKQGGSIKRNKKYVPSRLKEVTANDTGSQISGWMYRKGRRSWKRLWFVLKEQVLYVYKASEDVVAVESIPILGYKIETLKEGTYDDAELQHIFQLSHANQQPLVFSVDGQHSANRWISAFQDATVLK